ncbi:MULTISPECIES: GerAB/ArcD/ProY family transporter [Lysinibacillus]|uniref:GerAB/ArcD/ProY family transporter n=1 Tax=Lysinibacillus TaxID=400634 RepID=UPI00083C9602|nr:MULTISPECIES: GerAB/ArcD/ProY family transporter [Lysinibacillus]EDW5948285.1 GerAB/ArcD/ProY family transporter [Salmonella enterica subsp. enterica serovar Enteritidis]
MKNRINLTTIQLTFFIIQTQIGVGILGLPSNVFSTSKQDSWMSILFSGIVIQVIILMMWGIGRRFPSMSLFHYSTQLIGKVAGTSINIIYIIYGVMVASLVLMYSSAIIKMWVLPLTPKWIVIALLTLTAVYIGKETVLEISSFFVVVSGLIVLLIIISFIVMFTYPVDWRFLFPIGHSGIGNILRGAKEAYFSMLGFELILILYPYFQHIGEKKVLFSVSIANLFVTLLYTFLMVVTMVTFSPDELLTIPQPVLYFVKSLYLQIVERIDLFFISLWIINVITTLTSYLFLATEGCLITFSKYKNKGRTIYILLLSAIASGVALIPNKESEIDLMNKAVSQMSNVTLLIIPLFLFGISILFRESGRM